MFEVSRCKRRIAGIVLLVGVAGTLHWVAGEPESDTPAIAEWRNGPPAKGDSRSVALGNAAATQAPGATEPPLWRAVDENSVGALPFFADGWSPEGRVLVGVAGALSAAHAWQVGDRLTIPVPQTGETYRPVIDQIDDGPGHSRAALGKVLDAHGHPRRIVVTVGPTSLFAFIDTPDGAYELVADSEYGWLLPTSSMMAGLDFSVPDYILPEDGARKVLVPSGRPDDSGI